MRNRDEAVVAECHKQISDFQALVKADGGLKAKHRVPKTDDAVVEDWLRTQLQEHRFLLSDYVRYQAQKNGFTYKRLRKARKKIGAVAWSIDESKTHHGFWFWELRD